MDLNDFFRGFFGFNRMRPDDSFDDPFTPVIRPNNTWFFDDDSDRPPQDPITSFFNRSFPSIFHQMEDMFSNMYSIETGFSDFPDFESPSNPGSPRDQMLRNPDRDCCQQPWCKQPLDYLEPHLQVDDDLDDKIKQSGLSVLKDERPLVKNSPSSWSFKKSVSIRTVRTADGTMEEHHTATDSSGNKVTTVRRSIGDQSHQVTTQTDKHGLVEKKEDFINMDENDISKFQEKWGNAKTTNQSQQPLTNITSLFTEPAEKQTFLPMLKKIFWP